MIYSYKMSRVYYYRYGAQMCITSSGEILLNGHTLFAYNSWKNKLKERYGITKDEAKNIWLSLDQYQRNSIINETINMLGPIKKQTGSVKLISVK